MRSDRMKHKGRIDNWQDRAEYRLLVAVSFILCLAMVIFRRAGYALKGQPRRTDQNFISEAWAAAHATAGYAFIV
ncbi:hypothetical protein JM93_02668 [Roseibium hamelinense]|uniref:Uncharacterized protein n=1 Tax=Roseibium hamelinense TaxID=150831 RepID=A0A562SXI4_9HYPH|nr:hypothetical protein [Roseibium hamelinense]MTI44845.1 hypothetical protein [Roseibium hamelinense]TWI85961.1 hypothetical protein JM93_02668 [Roseibium hamelinense]